MLRALDSLIPRNSLHDFDVMVQARHRSCTAVELVAINGNQVVTANQKDVAVAFGREWLEPRVMVAVRAHELFLGKPFDANDAERARALARATLTTQVPWLPCEVLLTLASLDVMIKSHDTFAKEDGTTCLWEGRNLAHARPQRFHVRLFACSTSPFFPFFFFSQSSTKQGVQLVQRNLDESLRLRNAHRLQTRTIPRSILQNGNDASGSFSTITVFSFPHSSALHSHFISTQLQRIGTSRGGV